MTRQTYDNPPAWEVSFQASFDSPVSPGQVRGIAQELAGEFESQEEEKQVTVSFTLAALEAKKIEQTTFDGFVLRAPDAGWTCRVKASTFLLHFTRGAPWPKGTYCGWDAFRSKLERVTACASEAFAESKIQRLGLRYLNKIAIPREEIELTEWFAMEDFGPDELCTLAGFDHRFRYRQRADPSYEASWRLVNHAVEDPGLAKQNAVGALLDIDVFSSSPAFRLDGLLTWADAAHTFENDLFEKSIRDPLRDLFNGRHVS